MKNKKHSGVECSRPRRLIGMGITAGITFALTTLLLLWMADADARGKPPGGGAKPPPSPPATEPVARFRHGFMGNGAQYSQNRLYLYGGETVAGGSFSFLSDFWSLNLNMNSPTWTRIGSSGAAPGNKSGFGFSCTETECLLTGGVFGGDETWVYRFGSKSWSKLNCKRNLCPSGRLYSALVYDQAHGGYVLFGGIAAGRSDSELNDTYFFDPATSTWTLMDAGSSAVPGRYLASAVAVPGGVVMYGGLKLNGSPAQLGDMYFWDGNRWAAITQTGSGPVRLYQHDMAFDGNRVIVAGGSSVDDGTANQQVWTFTFDAQTNTANWSSLMLQCDRTPVRDGSRMAYDAASKTLVFFGGTDGPTITLAYADLTICSVNQ